MFKSLGERLKELRAEKNVSISTAADAMEISQGVLSDYERDKKLPGYEALKKIAAYYGVCYDYLFCETESRNSENVSISKKLGLSDKAIANIEKLKNSTIVSGIFNNFLENDKLSSLFYSIETYVKFYLQCFLHRETAAISPRYAETRPEIIEAIEIIENAGYKVPGSYEQMILSKELADTRLNEIIDSVSKATLEKRRMVKSNGEH